MILLIATLILELKYLMVIYKMTQKRILQNYKAEISSFFVLYFIN